MLHNDESVIVSDITVSSSPGGVELSADLDGFRLWYRLPPGWPVAARGDAFLAPAQLAAMSRGEALEFAAPTTVSAVLLRGAANVQEVFNCWDPRLRRVALRAAADTAPSPIEGIASFFSGGVDSAYTLHKRAAEITHLILVRGSDIGLGDDRLFEAVVRRAGEVASAYGKTLVVVETNSLELGHASGIVPHMYYGAILAGVALALGFAGTYVSSGLPYTEIYPDGAHAVIDHHWSTESTFLAHDGAEALRSQKLRALAAAPLLLKYLRVCVRSGGYNCGSCEKCLRTRVALRLLGLESGEFARLRAVEPLRHLRLATVADFAFWRDNHDLAVAVGDIEVARILRSRLGRYFVRRTLVEADRIFFGGRLQRLRQGLPRRHRDDGDASPLLPSSAGRSLPGA